MTNPTLFQEGPPPTPGYNVSYAQLWLDRTTNQLKTMDEQGVITVLTAAGGGPPIAFVAPVLSLGDATHDVQTLLIGAGDTIVTPAARLVRFTDASGVDNSPGVATIQAPRGTGTSASSELDFAIGLTAGASSAALGTVAALVRLFNNAPAGTSFGVVNITNPVAGPTGAAYNKAGALWVGNPAGVTIPGDMSTPRLVTVGDASDSAAMRSYLYHATASFGPGVLSARARGTVAVPAVVQAGDVLLLLQAAGCDLTTAGNFSGNVGGVRVLAAEIFADATHHGTQVEISTTLKATAARRAVALFQDTGDEALQVVGAGYQLKEGANAKSGLAVLVGGTVTVATTKASATMRVLHARQTTGGVTGNVSIANVVAGVSFDLLSSSGADTSSLYWQIWEPA